MANHQHPCRYCGESFVCGYDAFDCYEQCCTCDDCFVKHERKIIFMLLFFLILAVGGTVVLIDAYAQTF